MTCVHQVISLQQVIHLRLIFACCGPFLLKAAPLSGSHHVYLQLSGTIPRVSCVLQRKLLDDWVCQSRAWLSCWMCCRRHKSWGAAVLNSISVPSEDGPHLACMHSVDCMHTGVLCQHVRDSSCVAHLCILQTQHAFSEQHFASVLWSSTLQVSCVSACVVHQCNLIPAP